MTRVLYLAYGLVAYLLFLVTILYAIGFLADRVVPKGIDDGIQTDPPLAAVVINVVLLGLFAVQHSVMARPAFKMVWTRIVPKPIERSTFVLFSSLLLLLLFWQWRPLPGIVWQIEQPFLAGLLWGLYFLGWAIVFYATFLIDHFDLFGLRQVTLHWKGVPYEPHPFMERSLYRWIRHPLMAGFVIAFWAAPTMTWGRLLFAAVSTAYILIAIRLEERDLASFLGEPYREYQERTTMLVPLPRKKSN